MWHCGSVDRMKGAYSLLDQTIATQQLKALIELCLVFTADPYREEVLQCAISY